VLSSEPPFSGNDAQTILAQQLAGHFDRSRFPEPVASWLARGLAADLGDRFADAGGMRQAWREIMREMRRRAKKSESWWGRVMGSGNREPGIENR